MQNQNNSTHPSIQAENNNNNNNRSSVNIDESIKSLKKTIETIKKEIDSVYEKWWLFFTDKRISEAKLTLTVQLEKILSSIQTKKGIDFLEVKGEINSIFTTLSYYRLDPKFSKISGFVDELNKHIVNLERYTNLLKDETKNKLNELRQLTNTHNTLLNVIETNPTKQAQIASILNIADSIKNNNLKLTKENDIKTKENKQLKFQLNRTIQERNALIKENAQMKEKEAVYKEKEKQSDNTIKNQALEKERIMNENQDLKTKNITLETEIKTRKSSYTADDYKTLMKQYEKLEGECIEMDKENKSLVNLYKRKTQRLSVEKDTLQKRIYQLENSNNTSATHNNRSQQYKSTTNHHNSVNNPYQLFTTDSHIERDSFGLDGVQSRLYEPNY